MHDCDHPSRVRDNHVVHDRQLAGTWTENGRRQDRVVGLLSELVGTQLRRVPTKEAVRVLAIDRDRADHGAVVDDPMDDVGAGHALGDACYGIVAKLATQRFQQIDFALIAKLVGGLAL